MPAKSEESETHHLTCPVCGALPGTTCVDGDFHDRPQVHPSRRMTISERNWRTQQGWQPPELAKEKRRREKQGTALSVLFDPRIRTDTKAVRKALSRRRQVSP
jgi:hypothetical protein